MSDIRSNTVKTICHKYLHDDGCAICPLYNPCRARPGDTDEIHDGRVNRYAEGMKVSIADQHNAVFDGVL